MHQRTAGAGNSSNSRSSSNSFRLHSCISSTYGIGTSKRGRQRRHNPSDGTDAAPPEAAALPAEFRRRAAAAEGPADEAGAAARPGRAADTQPATRDSSSVLLPSQEEILSGAPPSPHPDILPLFLHQQHHPRPNLLLNPTYPKASAATAAKAALPSCAAAVKAAGERGASHHGPTDGNKAKGFF